jgi:hypothetical protein
MSGPAVSGDLLQWLLPERTNQIGLTDEGSAHRHISA